jgi:hypothetical protein
VLADVLDPWLRVTEWKGKRKIQERFALIWQSAKTDPDSGKRFELATEFTYSTYETAALRPFLEGWLGADCVETETIAEETLRHLPDQIGQCGIASIVHKAVDDRVYVNIRSMSPLMEGMKPITVQDYSRNPYWAKRRAQCATEVAAFEAEEAAREAHRDETLADFPEALKARDDDDSSLPF